MKIVIIFKKIYNYFFENNYDEKIMKKIVTLLTSQWHISIFLTKNEEKDLFVHDLKDKRL